MRYRWDGKRPIMKIGEYPAMSLAEARAFVSRAQDGIKQGLDPQARAQRAQAERRAMPTVTEFIDEYIARYAKPNKKTWKKEKQTMEQNVVPVIGKIPLDEVTRRDIVGVLDIIQDRGSPSMAEHCYAYMRRMFGFAVERGILDFTPTQYIRVPKGKARDVVFNDEAIRHFWACTASYRDHEKSMRMRQPTRLNLRLLLLTGQRSSEVAGIPHSELDLSKRMWLLPAERAKNGLANTIPLSDLAMEVIHEALEYADDKYLFPSKSKFGHLTVSANTQAMERIFDGWQPRYITHDLRRTVGTRLPALGVSRLIADKVLNHKDSSVGGIYDRHTYDDEKREALGAWADELAALVR